MNKYFLCVLQSFLGTKGLLANSYLQVALNSSISGGDIPMTPTNTNTYTSNGAAMPSHGTATDRQRSMSIPRKSVGDLKNGSSAATARSQIAQPPVPTIASQKQTPSMTRQSVSDLRDRNDVPGIRQSYPTREQALPSAVNSEPTHPSSIQQVNAILGIAPTHASSAQTGPSNTPYTTPRIGEIRQGRQQLYNREYLVEGATSPPSLHGIVDLTNTVDTTTHIRYAPGKSFYLQL